MCKTEEGKNQFLIGEVQGAVKSILFYFQISFREVYTLSENSGLAGGKKKKNLAGNGQVKDMAEFKAKACAEVRNDTFHLLWQDWGEGGLERPD